MSLPRPWYRTRQFLQALRPQLSVQERQEVATFLRNDLFALFQSMTLRDQRHSLDVYNFLRAQGNDDRELLTAALLHDVGKGGRVQLWERVT
ncbi:MAG TPA: HD domain-containing protein, partial [Dehalococcoidia bacterium]|nr:HD domain-containing protein [Dehalococcoidia bacterium]